VRLTVDACLAAVADAGLTLDDIDGLSTTPARMGSPGFSEGGIAPLTERCSCGDLDHGAATRPGKAVPSSPPCRGRAGLCRHGCATEPSGSPVPALVASASGPAAAGATG